jgi:anti-anti-sigma regulatory factor
VVGIAQARELADAARAAVDRGTREVVVRGADLRAIDTSSVQILVALRRALAAQGRALRLDGLPRAIVQRCERAGLGHEMASG